MRNGDYNCTVAYNLSSYFYGVYLYGPEVFGFLPARNGYKVTQTRMAHIKGELRFRSNTDRAGWLVVSVTRATDRSSRLASVRLNLPRSGRVRRCIVNTSCRYICINSINYVSRRLTDSRTDAPD